MTRTNQSAPRTVTFKQYGHSAQQQSIGYDQKRNWKEYVDISVTFPGKSGCLEFDNVEVKSIQLSAWARPDSNPNYCLTVKDRNGDDVLINWKHTETIRVKGGMEK